MILSGKTLTHALKGCKDKLPELHFASHFDAGHALYQDKEKQKPLFSCTCQSNLSLPLVKTMLFAAAGILILCYCCHKRKNRNCNTMS